MRPPKQLLIDFFLLLLAIVTMIVAMQQPGDMKVTPLFFVELNPQKHSTPTPTEQARSSSHVDLDPLSPEAFLASTEGTPPKSQALAQRCAAHLSSLKPPVPLITDLEGDGRNELVVVTQEPRLKVFKFYSSLELTIAARFIDAAHANLLHTGNVVLAARPKRTPGSLLYDRDAELARNPNARSYFRRRQVSKTHHSRHPIEGPGREQLGVVDSGRGQGSADKVSLGNLFLQSLPPVLLELADGRMNNAFWTPLLFPRHAIAAADTGPASKDRGSTLSPYGDDHSAKMLHPEQDQTYFATNPASGGQLVMVSATPVLTDLVFDHQAPAKSRDQMDCKQFVGRQVAAVAAGYVTNMPLIDSARNRAQNLDDTGVDPDLEFVQQEEFGQTKLVDLDELDSEQPKELVDERRSGIYAAAPASQSRRRIIVAVTMDWTVLCFDHRMRLIWAHHVDKRISEPSFVVDASIYIVPSVVNQNTLESMAEQSEIPSGYVVIAGRAAKLPGMDKGGLMEDAGDKPETLLSDNTHFDAENHFSYVALSLATGQELWRHGAESFQATPDPAEILRPGKDHHKDEDNWLPFRDQLTYGVLPMIWTSPFNTALRGISLIRKREGFDAARVLDKSLSQHLRWAHGLMGIRSMEAPDVSSRLSDPSLTTEDIAPNTLVAQSREGIELLDPRTGATMTRLRLQPGLLHVDLDGDGVIDHVAVEPLVAPRLDYVHSHNDTSSRLLRVPRSTDGSSVDNPSSTPEPKTQCKVTVTSGVGSQSEFYMRIDPCQQLEENLLGVPLATTVSAGTYAAKPGSRGVEFAPPLARPLARYSGERPRYELHLFASNGAVMSLDHQGEVLWVTQSKYAMWRDETSAQNSKLDNETEPSLRFIPLNGEAYSLAQMHPALRFSLERTAELLDRNPSAESDVALIAIGKHGLVLIDPTDGTLRAEVPFTGTAIGDIAVGRIDYDGLNDFVITTKQGYLGFRVERVFSTSVFTLVLAVLAGVLLICFIIKYSSTLKMNQAKRPALQSSPVGAASSPVGDQKLPASPIGLMSLRWSKRQIVDDPLIRTPE